MLTDFSAVRNQPGFRHWYLDPAPLINSVCLPLFFQPSTGQRKCERLLTAGPIGPPVTIDSAEQAFGMPVASFSLSATDAA